MDPGIPRVKGTELELRSLVLQFVVEHPSFSLVEVTHVFFGIRKVTGTPKVHLEEAGCLLIYFIYPKRMAAAPVC